ncbi:helix-turn-helix domain-containing protein [Neisseria brasiliensis]|uniref:helix-turn-helix domain-containing protein n=1 Tax=Neisseria brasiliensis TaxID=2666100 RepID=UPI0012A97AFA|nr:helix-turn-helix transcriptional regulator [Neisseria brasiliensis]QGL25021.1 helix-turn-helix domain-containing protein [Neisseria brasiliensis]
MKEVSLFANRLKEERKKLGLTQAQAAEKCGISMRMWGDYERGKYFPRNENLIGIEKIGIDIQYVMHGRRDETAAMPSEKLSKEEQELLDLFRQASDLGRAVIVSAARGAEKKAETAADKVSNG